MRVSSLNMATTEEDATLGITLIDCGSAKVPDLEAALRAWRCEVQRVPLAGASGHHFGRGAVIISGGPLLFSDHGVGARLGRQFAFFDALELPALGICLGHQGMGVRAGARVHLGVERRCAETITVCAEHPLFAGLPPTFSMTTDHCEGIGLPPGFLALASSRHYQVEAMASRSRPHFGVQFHPEVSGEPGRIVLRNFIQLARSLDK